MKVPGLRTRNEHQTTPGIICQPCQEDSVVKQAYGYCINCEEYLCETCYKYHRRQKRFKEHVLVDEDIEKFQPEYKESEELPPVPEKKKILNTKCNIHSDEDLKYHCKTHNAIMCSVCAIKRHKGCPNLLYIPEIFDSANEDHKRKIEYVQRKVEYKINKERDARKRADESYKFTLSVLETQRNQVNRYFEETKKRFSSKVAAFREESKKREKEILGLDQKLKYEKDLATVSTSSSESEIYLSMLETEKEIKAVSANLSGMFNHPSLALSYTPRQPLPQLGEAKVKEQQGILGTRKLKLLRKVIIAGGEVKCSITDGAIVSNSGILLILADRENDRLVTISQKYDVKFYQCQAGPWGVTCISKSEVAVSFPDAGEILFYNVKGTVSNRKSIKVAWLPFAIRYYTSECSLLVSVSSNLDTSPSSKIKSWSVDGQLLRTIASVAHNISHITLAAESKIAFSSHDPLHLVCLLDLDDTVLRSFDYIDDNMLGPFGVASDAEGNIYVCGKDCLRVVSKQGKWEQILHQDDGFYSQSVLVCDKTNRLFIGQARSSTDVLVFQV